MNENILWLHELRLADLARVGGKNSSLGEMIGNLAGLGVSVPGGYATTAEAFKDFIAHNDLSKRIFDKLATLDVEDVAALTVAGKEIRGWVIDAPLQPQLDQDIRSAYKKLCDENGGGDVAVAVRSSATAEDLPDASFAGQQETFLNVTGADDVVLKVKEVFASLYNDRAIAYRVHHGFKHEDVFLSSGVQLMVRSGVGSSGVLFTLDTESGFRDVVFVTSSFGLGEMVVQGAVNPDEFYVYKPTLSAGKPAILRRSLGSKAIRMVYSDVPGERVRIEDTPAEQRNVFSISDEDVQELSKQALVIEKHYGRPMDIEWAKDGVSGKLFIVQARPENGEVAWPCHPDRAFRAEPEGRQGAGRRPRRGRQDRCRYRPRGEVARRHGPRAARRRADCGHDRPRLGAGDEACLGHRDQPRWPYLPRGDHRS